MLAILAWRLGDRLSDFLKLFPRETAMSILTLLPKGLALSAARQAFPGAWGDLLNPSFQAKALDPETVRKASESARAFLPLGDFVAIEKYRKESELREYLRVTDPATEREIYQASPADSGLHRLRPAFYKVLEASDTLLSALVPRFSPEQWAMTFMNVPKSDRGRIQKLFNEKQNYLFIENLKRFDAAGISLDEIGRMREAIAIDAVSLELRILQEAALSAAPESRRRRARGDRYFPARKCGLEIMRYPTHSIIGIFILGFLGLSASGAEAQNKVDLGTGFYSLTGKSTAGTGGLSGLGAYRVGYRRSISAHWEAGVGYNLIYSSITSGDSIFGLDLGANYFPWTSANPVVRESNDNQSLRIDSDLRPFVGLTFQQRSLQSSQSGFNGFGVGFGLERTWTERLSITAITRYSKLSGSKASSAVLIDFFLGITCAL